MSHILSCGVRPTGELHKKNIGAIWEKKERVTTGPRYIIIFVYTVYSYVWDIIPP